MQRPIEFTFARKNTEDTEIAKRPTNSVRSVTFVAKAVDVRTPAARLTDPVTSHEAAEAITNSGRRQKQQQAVLQAIRSYPGCTGHELARFSGLNYYVIMRRVSEIELAGRITRGEARMCGVTGRKATMWFPVTNRAPRRTETTDATLRSRLRYEARVDTDKH